MDALAGANGSRKRGSMSDLISRQEAFDEIIWNSDNGVIDAKVAIEALRKLPSVEPEKCSDCISRKAATDRFDLVQSDDKCMGYDDIMAFLSSLPSVEPERKTGKWEWNRRTGEYVCSECGCNPIYERETPDVSEIDKYRYCRWCGAEMEVGV